MKTPCVRHGLKLTFLVLALSLSSTLVNAATVKEIFSKPSEVQKLLSIEAALARVQADLGIIPGWAAEELTLKADASNIDLQELAAERAKVGHRMVALLNVWGRSIDRGAEEYMHFGATTVDIFDTLLVLQLSEAGRSLLTQLQDLELLMIDIADSHKDTLMMGRTLGQHALPITFGKKVSSWLGENRRNIERLKMVLERVEHSAILKGAVGSYLGLGENGIAVERGFSAELGLHAPYLDDWHPARDVFAEYALTLAIISKSWGRVGNELFLLQLTDIAETEEVRPKSAVGSSTMPHKKNPSKSEALIHYSRVIPRSAEVVLDDMVNTFERDNTSRTNSVIEEISVDTQAMLKLAHGLLANLKVNSDNMATNVEKTRGLIMAQRVTFALADHIGKTSANKQMHEIAVFAIDNGLSLREALKQFPDVAQFLTEQQLDELFDAATYTGLAAEQVDAVIAYCRGARQQDQLDGYLNKAD